MSNLEKLEIIQQSTHIVQELNDMKTKINGKNISFNIYDMKDAKRYEDALKVLADDENEIKASVEKMEDEETSMYVFLEKQINMIKKFFVSTTGVDVIDDCTDLLAAREMYDQFLKAIKSDQKKIAQFSTKRIH